MKATIKWQGGTSFVGTADSGHRVVMDGAPEIGGRNLGARPMELVLIGMGGCTAIDVAQILRKSRQEVTDCIAELEATRAESIPKVFDRIHVHFRVSGTNLDSRKVARAVELSAEKYCSATAMLRKTARISYDFEIIEST